MQLSLFGGLSIKNAVQQPVIKYQPLTVGQEFRMIAAIPTIPVLKMTLKNQPCLITYLMS